MEVWFGCLHDNELSLSKNPKFEKSKTMRVLTKRYNEIQKIFDEEDCSGSLFLICKKIRG